MTGKSTTAVFGAKPEDYRRFGLAADHIEPWEDGARTDGSA